MSRCLFRSLTALFVGLAVTLLADAGDMKAERDYAKNVKLLTDHFRRYPTIAKAIQPDPQGLRFLLTTDTKKPEQTGLYSLFALAGDFEISANFEWTPVVVPKDGYGVSCGIAVDSDNWSVSIGRGNYPGDGSSYDISVGKRIDRDMKYERKLYKTEAKTGRLVLKRDRKNLICLAADSPTGELNELDRFTLTADTIRKVRLFADPGKAPTTMDARLTQIQLKADEITTDIPKSEAGSSLWWWIGLSVLVIAAVAGFLLYRRHRRRFESE